MDMPSQMARALAKDKRTAPSDDDLSWLPWDEQLKMVMQARQKHGQASPEVAQDNLRTALEWAPGTGEAVSAQDAWEASGRAGDALASGDFGEALSGYGDMALGLLGALPFVGMAARAGKRARGAFEMDYFGQPMRIMQNPSPQEAKGFLNRTKYKAARRIVDPDTGDEYIWDAGDPAMHAMVAEKLGIDPKRMQGDVIGLDD